MLATIKTATVCGLESVPIDVEVDVAKMSFPAFTVVGLPDKAIDESRERVRSAIKNSGADFPQHRITVNLAPADFPKNGPAFDLPIALGLLIASEQLAPTDSNIWVAGELSLDGTIRPIVGTLAIAALAQQHQATALFIPQANATEAALIKSLPVYGLTNLNQLILHLNGTQPLTASRPTRIPKTTINLTTPDMAEVLGQEQAKRALEIAAAGGHNILLQGLPGSGKTMLAQAFASIMPPLSLEESLEVSTIYSVCGMLGSQPIQHRPFRSPHHTTSDIGLIGGGATPKPGEISLAHRGVLFLDEFAEFPRHVLEALRQPLEDGVITVSRAKASYTFPARFQLIAAQNPCPCGHFNDPQTACTCSTRQITNYRKRVSGPLLDRIDLFIDVPRVKDQQLINHPATTETSQVISQRIASARQHQRHRFTSTSTTVLTNAAMTSQQTKTFCQLDTDCQQLMTAAIGRYHLSARGYFRLLKVARTIADLADTPAITTTHLSEALQYRAPTI